jgi:HEAT repeat protein
LLATALSNGNADSMRRAVVAAVRAEPAIAAHCAPCVSAFAAAALDPRQPAADRVAMLQVLGDFERTEVVTLALGAASKDANPAVRAAGLLAALPAGRGRVGIIRMAPLLHDPAPEMRAAAAAGVLRAGGDLGIEQLYLLARERDPRPLIAAATELGKMNTEASAELLGKWLKRSDKNVRRAVIQALAARHDEPARALVDPILRAAAVRADEDPVVRELALRIASPEQVSQMAASDPRVGRPAYRALLAANLRQDAAHWLLAHLDELGPTERIGALGEWIAESPKLAARN